MQGPPNPFGIPPEALGDELAGLRARAEALWTEPDRRGIESELVRRELETLRPEFEPFSIELEGPRSESPRLLAEFRGVLAELRGSLTELRGVSLEPGDDLAEL